MNITNEVLLAVDDMSNMNTYEFRERLKSVAGMARYLAVDRMAELFENVFNESIRAELTAAVNELKSCAARLEHMAKRAHLPVDGEK